MLNSCSNWRMSSSLCLFSKERRCSSRYNTSKSGSTTVTGMGFNPISRHRPKLTKLSLPNVSVLMLRSSGVKEMPLRGGLWLVNANSILHRRERYSTVWPEAQSPLYTKHLRMSSMKKDLNCGRGVSYLIFLMLNMMPRSMDVRWAILSRSTCLRLGGKADQISGGKVKVNVSLNVPCLNETLSPCSMMEEFT